MASLQRFPVKGERYCPPDLAASPSSLPPLPYYPYLKQALRSVTASIVTTYLEIHHPAPPDPPLSRLAVATQPVTLDLDAVAYDLAITRRTLYVSLCIL